MPRGTKPSTGLLLMCAFRFTPFKPKKLSQRVPLQALHSRGDEHCLLPLHALKYAERNTYDVASKSITASAVVYYWHTQRKVP